MDDTTDVLPLPPVQLVTMADLEARAEAQAAAWNRLSPEEQERRQLVARIERAERLRGDAERDLEELAARFEALVASRDTADGLPWAECLADLDPDADPVRWLVEDLLTAGEIALMVGDGGSFKSTAAIHLAGAVAGGYPAFGHFAVQQKPTLIVSAEDPASVVLMRMNAFIAGHGWEPARVLGNTYVLAGAQVMLSSAQWQARLLREIAMRHIGLVVLDAMADLVEGDENSNTEVRPIIRFVRALAESTRATPLLVHHAGKGGIDKRPLDRIRGASALPSAARSILFTEYHPEGVLIEHLKMSRAPRLPTFVLHRSIDADPANRTLWRSATLTYSPARSATLNRAEQFILAQVTSSPRTLSSSDLRNIGAPLGIRREDIAQATARLQALRMIGFEAGKRGAKLWFPAPKSA